MTLSMSAEFDRAQLRKLQRDLRGIKRGVPRAISSSIKRSTSSVRSRLVKGIASNINVRQRDLFGRGKRRAVRQRTFPSPMATTGHIEVTGRRIPLSRFSARQTKRGTSYKIDRGGGRKMIEGAFIARMRSGHVGVFSRVGGGRSITELHGPSVPHVAENEPKVRRLMRVEAGEIMEHNLASQVDRLLKRSRA